LQSTNKTSATRTFEITTTDNTNTGALTFSGFASGYKVTVADITALFERHRCSLELSVLILQAELTMPLYFYRVEIDNNINNPSDSTIKYTTNGTEPTKIPPAILVQSA
jgi:hypothetical protein